MGLAAVGLAAVPVPTPPAPHRELRVLSGATQGGSSLLLPQSLCLANVSWGIPSAGA